MLNNNQEFFLISPDETINAVFHDLLKGKGKLVLFKKKERPQ